MEQGHLAKGFVRGELGDRAEGQIYKTTGNFKLINIKTDEGKKIWESLDKNPEKAVKAGYDGVEMPNYENLRLKWYYPEIDLDSVKKASEIKLFKKIKLDKD